MSTNKQLAFVFPGQGSQSVGMLGSYAGTSIVQSTYAEASEVLGFDLWDMTQSGPDDALNATANTQPAMLTAGIAMWRVWQDSSDQIPGYMAGHSLGEYSALVAAGSMQFSDAVALVAQRGTFMQEAVAPGEGAMAAVIGLADDSLIDVCAAASDGGSIVSAANFNAPGQVVIAGSADAVERAIVAAKEAGAKRAIPLPVSVPSHCSLMQPAAERLQAALADIEIVVPSIPVIHNTNAATSGDADSIRSALTAQLSGSVQWVKSIGVLSDAGVTQVIECGPGKVLTGLMRRIDKKIGAYAMFDADSVAKVKEAINVA